MYDFHNLDWFWGVISGLGSIIWRFIVRNFMNVVQSSKDQELKLDVTAVNVLNANL